MAKPFLSSLIDANVLWLDDLTKERLRQFLRGTWLDVVEPDQDEEWVEERKEYFRDQWEKDFLDLSLRADSPIEQLLGAYLLCVDDGYNEVKYTRDPDEISRPEFGTILCNQQTLVQPYRSDFVFNLSCRDDVRFLAVECDGHDFHEKTKNQAARDKTRDRDFIIEGVPVLRFTGSQIYLDPCNCAEEISLLLAGMMDRLTVESGAYPRQRRHKASWW